MPKLHVVATMRTVDVVVLHDASADRALVAASRDPIEEPRRQCDHQQADYCLPHETFLRTRSEHRHHWTICGAENRVTAERRVNQLDYRLDASRPGTLREQCGHLPARQRLHQARLLGNFDPSHRLIASAA